MKTDIITNTLRDFREEKISQHKAFDTLVESQNQHTREVSKEEARKALEAVRDKMTEKMELFNKKQSQNMHSLWGDFADIVDGDIELINEQIEKL